ncbi:hypothetical protein [Fulvivirga lutimaris]|uniref:hypothetical protein n=1 Tax=Fulvivirga lutimaris TaxID=1819566 RepID=UPI0012BCE1C0|nr:hypothetical protein [Fulvivirga lutimaris]MTI38880.1 hypothetical protein [Fulvivirga lutimaris]
MTNTNRKRGAYFVLAASVILLVFNLVETNFNKGTWYMGPLSNILLIVSMIITLREIKKQEQNT